MKKIIHNACEQQTHELDNKIIDTSYSEAVQHSYIWGNYE